MFTYVLGRHVLNMQSLVIILELQIAFYLGYKQKSEFPSSSNRKVNSALRFSELLSVTVHIASCFVSEMF